MPAERVSAVLEIMQATTGNTLVVAAAEQIDLTEAGGIEQLRQLVAQEVELACIAEWERLSSRERMALARQLGASDEKHVKCAIAAMVGEVCSLPGKLIGDVATAVGDRVAERTGSVIAGKMASKAADRLIANVLLPASPLGPVDQVGLLADVAAVALCPSQQGGNRKRHGAVEECAARLAARTLKEAVGVA
ncbi:hypothetical protein ACFO6V_02865 [Promicromonospora alba]|uniref:DUF222 domain-containing protein n=1 Tax=Promicromonospora alba TaxID=1616110 RepID=A0ABV9HD62_9MICO